ncbi:hypothetical protein [Sphingomonas sp. NFR04]|uniref:hypothetical protein n=1 Tax=Sphingomonas sp. NFR04 TaxID=1566283 RepID=UPI0020C8C091|nr:hypothetical protein [Sphingomonas sp. NFR04]
MRILLLLSFAWTTALTSATACAQQAPAEGGGAHGMVALGAGIVPEFDGAGDVRPFPFATADIRWRGVNFQLRGNGARVDLVSDPRFAAGPVIGPRLPMRRAPRRAGSRPIAPDPGCATSAGG